MQILKSHIRILLILFFSFAALSANPYDDIRIVESNQDYMIIEWQVRNFQLQEFQYKNETYQTAGYDNGESMAESGHPDIPYRTVTIGVPPNSNPTVQILNRAAKTFRSVQLAPQPDVQVDKNGLSYFIFEPDPEIYTQNRLIPANPVQLSEENKFRDIPIRKIHLTPLQYNPVNRTLHFSPATRLKISYNQKQQISRTFRKQGALDDLYPEILLNFDQAKHWQTTAPVSLKKAASLPGGAWYKITVTEDGLYKIPASTLESAGISLSGLSTDAIRIFNNGGHTLNVKSYSDVYNPTSTLEIPVLVRDVNQNNNFDGSDYILFYGKHVNGWFYEPGSNDFAYQQHPYAKENYYWLNVNSSGGKRIEKQNPGDIQGAATAEFFYDRYHFEEDLYNILASGPDWYGNRFFGKTGSYSKNFTIVTNSSSASQPYLVAQFKGASGAKYGDNEPYRYYFDISLNTNKLVSDYTFTEERLKMTNRVNFDPALLKNGVNNFSLNYTGTLEGCSAHLDWFELFYPRGFSATNNQLSFFTGDLNQPRRYRISGLSQTGDIHVFDISDPANPVILRENMPVQNGAVEFDLPASVSPKNILVSSLASSEINTVSRLESFTPQKDLLNTNNQADLIIVTHKTFLPWAQQLAELRSHLSSEIVTMADIYFYFNAGVPDPTALRNFIRYAYYNWQKDAASHVLLFGDGHYDYRNIVLPDTMRVPPFEIFAEGEIDNRTTDNFFVDLNYNSDGSFRSINPDLSLGRLPMESKIDCERMLEKLIIYEENPVRDGWQTVITMVGDDEVTSSSDNEWLHQNQSEELASLPVLSRFIFNKIYLSNYPSVPGGFGRVKPAANQALIDRINQGSLIVNYVGHGSPVQWAHEAVFTMSRDLSRLSNEGKFPFFIAATCDFGKYDDPHEPSFTEAMIWKENAGAIGVLASTRLVFSGENKEFNKRFYNNLFAGGRPSKTLGAAKLAATYSGPNDQKYHLFADPTMTLADPREQIDITRITPDTLKALSQVKVEADVISDNQRNSVFNGGAVLIVNDARYDSVDTGGNFLPVTLPGPMIFKGEVSVSDGRLQGEFIVPKSIRYVNKKTGRITIYAWDDDNNLTAVGYNNKLLLNGSTSIDDSDGPEIEIYFEDQENFSAGDLIPQNPILVAAIGDENGINITGETGHQISLQINDETPKNISGFFFYQKNSFKNGFVKYPLDELDTGTHSLKITAFDNVNNPAFEETFFKIAGSDEMVLRDVVNYPNPFSGSTQFTFQTNRDGADVKVKIYTVTGRLIRELEGFSNSGFNDQITWEGYDEDGDLVANGVYLYKIILKNDTAKKEVIEKLVIVR